MTPGKFLCDRAVRLPLPTQRNALWFWDDEFPASQICLLFLRKGQVKRMNLWTTEKVNPDPSQEIVFWFDQRRSYCDQVLPWCCSSLLQACCNEQMWYFFVFPICGKFSPLWTDKSDTSSSFWCHRLWMSSAFTGACKRKIMISSPMKMTLGDNDLFFWCGKIHGDHLCIC